VSYTVSDLVQDVENSISEDKLYWKKKGSIEQLMINFEHDLKTQYPLETYILDERVDYETKVSIIRPSQHEYVKVELHYFEEVPFAFTIIDQSGNLQKGDTSIFNIDALKKLNVAINRCKSSCEYKKNKIVGIMEDISSMVFSARKLVC